MMTNNCPDYWDKNEWVIDYLHPAFPTEIRKYTFSTDSFQIGNYYYKQLIYNKNMIGGNWENTNEYFREINGKVYKIGGASGPTERLVYDMDFGIGDTLVPNIEIGQADREISNVGFINLLDNLPRKKTILTSNVCASSTTWVEGMGDIERLFWTETYCSLIDQDGFTPSIRCFSTDGQLLYLRPDLSGCYTSNTIDAQESAVNIYPNPADSYITIQLKTEKVAIAIQFFNALGQLVLNYSPDNSADIFIDITNLNSGFYTGQVIFKDGSMAAFKAVISK